MNTQILKLSLALVMLPLLLARTLAGDEVARKSQVRKVSKASALAKAARKAKPGDVIVVAAGRYKSWNAKVDCSGTAEHPIIIRPETSDGVTLFGKTKIEITGSHTVMQGFLFQDCKLEATPLALNGAQHCRVTDCRFADITQGKRPTYAAVWIQNNAADNRVDHCRFSNIEGRSVQVRIRNETDLPLRNRIDHNLFHDIPDKGANGRETIQVGHDQAKFGMMAPLTLVENNIFVRCNGENETISNKSSKNTYRNNYLKDCSPGWLHLRGGSYCVVEGNRLEGCQGGIAVHGTHHRIINNVIVNTRGPKERDQVAVWSHARGGWPLPGHRQLSYCKQYPGEHERTPCRCES
jgi:poly(beta-D-mannuronate) lyase